MPKLVYHDTSGVAGTVEVGTQTILIGRAVECQIQTQDALVSRKHARVVYDGQYWVEDLGSSNGVMFGGERKQRQQLRPGDVFRCGNLEVRFEADVSRGPSLMPLPPIAPSPLATMAPAPPAAVAPRPVAPPIMPPVAVAPPVPAVPLVAPAPPIAPLPAPGARGMSAAEAAEVATLRSELESERRRRTDLEFEVSEAKRKIAELGAAPPATSGSDAENERLRRRVDQLESELRRKGGVVSGTSNTGSEAALRTAEAERDRLRTRVTELETQLAAAPPKNDDHEMDLLRLRRRVEQLESELRRLRGGKALPEPAASDAMVTDLEDQVRRLKDERDEALRRAAGSASSDSKLVDELDRQRRRAEQLESELKRRPVGSVNEGNRLEAQRQELEGALRQLRDTERERDNLREAIAKGTGGPAPRPSPKAVENLTAVSDGLADIRAALRAAGDDLAMEQLEQVRTMLRQACALLNISL